MAQFKFYDGTQWVELLKSDDISAWAKASSKPSYNFSEIGAGSITIGDGLNTFYYRTATGVQAGFYYQTSGDESVVFMNRYNAAGWMFVSGVDVNTRPNWQDVTPTLQIKSGGVAIGKLIGQGVTPSYNLDVNGTLNATTIYQNGTALSAVATSGSYNDLSNKPTIPTNNNQLTNGAGYITGITSSMVTTALGYTPYNSSNPSGFITSSGSCASATSSTVASNVEVLTIPPTRDNTSGRLAFVVLSSEPSTKYNGYVYLITG